MPKLKGNPNNPFFQRYNAGIQTFRRLFTHWMDTNRWSHPVMIKLIQNCLEGALWFHSSQISAIRGATLINPGPRTFIAIAELNKALHLYKTKKQLLPGTKTDLDYLQGYAITQDGEAPGPEWWYGVFIGYIKPEGIPFDTVFLNDASASEFSERFARLMRQLMAANGYDIFSDLDKAIYRYYPAGDDIRVASLRDVLLNKTVWTAAEAEIELAALVGMTSELGGPTSTEELLASVG
jgi:hypothetical protein